MSQKKFLKLVMDYTEMMLEYEMIYFNFYFYSYY